jgi:DNA polymerase-1
LKPLLESDAVLKVGQNAKYDLNLARFGIMWPHRRHDGDQLRSGRGRSEDGIGGGHGMDELAAPPGPPPASPSRMRHGKSRSALPKCLAPATQYAAEDAEVTWRLHRLLKPAVWPAIGHAHL